MESNPERNGSGTGTGRWKRSGKSTWILCKIPDRNLYSPNFLNVVLKRKPRLIINIEVRIANTVYLI
jgi:hypothetical protein